MGGYTNAKHNRIKCLPLVNPKATTDCPAILPKLNWGYFLTLPKRAYSNQHFFVDSVMLVSARTVRLQPIATSLNRQIVQDIPSLTPKIYELLHSQTMFESTRTTTQPIPVLATALRPCKHGLSLPNEMHFFHSTICFVDSTMLLSTRSTRTSRQLIARALQPHNHGLIFSKSL